MTENLDFGPQAKSLIRQIILVLLVLTMTSGICHSEEFEVQNLGFIGASAFTDEELGDLILAREGDDFDARLVKLDKILLTNYYRSQGFLTAEVRDSLVIRRLEKIVEIYYLISENYRYWLGEIRINGNEAFSTNQLLNNFSESPLQQPFDESKIDIGKQKLENLYYNNGKPFVHLDLDYEFFQDTLVLVKINIIENHTVFIRDIIYSGLEHVQEFVVRRELEFKKGEMYNRQKFTVSQQNIYSSGLFDFVRFEIEPVADDSSQVLLKIDVQEKDPNWIGFKVGFAYEQELSYGNKLELTLEGGNRNILGTARSASLHLVPSLLYDLNSKKVVNPDNQITFMFVEPWIGYTRTPGVFQISYHQYRPVNSADFNVLQTSFNVSHEFQRIYRASGTVQAKIVNQLTEDVVDTILVQDAGKDLVFTVSLYGNRNTKNNFFNPGNGAYTDASLAYSHSLGKTPEGNEDIKRYLTMVTSWQRYQPLDFKVGRRKSGITLATRAKAGAIIEFGSTKNIPISDLFFAGGATTVRGYHEQLLGPVRKDENGIYKAIGGKLLFLANAEVRIPIIWLLVGEFFVDGGNVWREFADFKPGDIKLTTGLGLVILTPVGPIRFDYGRKLMQQQSDISPDAFHLGFYFAF